MRRASLIAVACLFTAPAAAAAPDPAYIRGKSEWLAQRYKPSTETLHTYRARSSARTAQLDYMIGTGGCRIAGRRAWGLNYLSWARYRYSLSPASRALVDRERAACRSAVAMPRLGGATAVAALQTAAGSWAQSKMYYLRNADEPVATYTAKPLGALDAAAVARRLVPVGNPAAIRAALQPTLPRGARVRVVSRFAFVTTARHTDAQLDAMAARIDTYLAFLDRTYGIRLPPNYLTLYLVPGQRDLRDIARTLHRLDVSPATIGYTFQDDQSAVALIPAQGIGTLFHELFHLVVRSTFGDVPQWVDEGMAALYEVSETRGRQVRGVRNWRGPVLRDLWAQRPTLREVITADWYVSDTPSEQFEFSGPPPGAQAITVQFAVARYFALYLQDKGKLAAVFARVQALQPGEDADPAAATLAAVVREIGPIDAVQRDFDRWFAATEGAPPLTSTAGVPRVDTGGPGQANALPSPPKQDCIPRERARIQQQQVMQLPICPS